MKTKNQPRTCSEAKFKNYDNQSRVFLCKLLCYFRGSGTLRCRRLDASRMPGQLDAKPTFNSLTFKLFY